MGLSALKRVKPGSDTVAPEMIARKDCTWCANCRALISVGRGAWVLRSDVIALNTKPGEA